MKNYFSILFVIACFNVHFSQEKKAVFYNENDEEVTETIFFNHINHAQNLDLYFENDTLITGILVKKINYGHLNDSIFKCLQKNLSPDKELTNELTVVVFYPGKDKCNAIGWNSKWNIFDYDYLKTLTKISNYSHFWIYKDDENLQYYYPKKVKWEKDKNQFIEKLFFQFHYPCSSAVIFDKKGNYISCLGEFGKSEIWKMAKELIEGKGLKE